MGGQLDKCTSCSVQAKDAFSNIQSKIVLAMAPIEQPADDEEAFSEFKDKLKQKYKKGKAEALKAFKGDDDEKIEKKEVTDWLEELGLDEDKANLLYDKRFDMEANGFIIKSDLAEHLDRKSSKDSRSGSKRNSSKSSTKDLSRSGSRSSTKDLSKQGTKDSLGKRSSRSGSKPPLSNAVQEFKDFIREKFKDPKAALAAMDHDGSDTVDKDEFVDFLTKYSFQGDAAELFNQLDEDKSGELHYSEFKDQLCSKHKKRSSI